MNIQTEYNNPYKSFDLSISIEEKRNFMHRPIKWIKQADDSRYVNLRKISVIVIAILMSCTILGLLVVIPGFIEWHRQQNNKSKIPSIINNTIKKSSDQKPPLKENISSYLARFDSSSVQGQVNGVYITTNETNLSATNTFLKTHPLNENSIHIGCASWYNFDIMCARKSHYGLIVDFNPKNAEFIKKTIEIIKISNSRESFKTAIIDYLTSLEGAEKQLFFHKDQKGLPTEKIEKELYRKESWLHDDKSYNFIKKLVEKEQIIAITEDITNFEKFAEIKNFLDSNNLFIDTLYLSNICNFMQTQKQKEGFCKTVSCLLNKNSLFINCPKIKNSNDSQVKILHQQILTGEEILNENFNLLNLFELTKD